jgi:hypothetical protein
MSWKGHCKNALFALALASFIAPPAEAIEIFMGANPATHVNDDLFTQVRGGRGGGGGGMRHHGGVHRGGGMHGGMHRGGAYGGMHRGGAYGGIHRGGAYGGNVNRNINRNVNRNVNRAGYGYRGGAGYGYRGGAVWAGRPGWYRWPAGGAIAAGAAIGFVGAASAAAWAGAPPSSGLCWYYTDASQRQGFWDSCP